MDIIKVRNSVIQISHDSGILTKLKGLNVSLKVYSLMQIYKSKSLPAIQLPKKYIFKMYTELLI